jgi:hypothetical protein
VTDTKNPKRNQLLIATPFAVIILVLASLTLLGSPSPQATADAQASSYLNLVDFYNQGSTPGAFAGAALDKAALTYPGVTIDYYSPQRALLSVLQGGTSYQVCVNLAPTRHQRFCQVTTP